LPSSELRRARRPPAAGVQAPRRHPRAPVEPGTLRHQRDTTTSDARIARLSGAPRNTLEIDELTTVAGSSDSVPDIYEKYLQKAITEINALGDEVAHAGAGTRVPVVGSGHPLADVFLLKYQPRASELQEGVAFFGRAGNALLKSLQRLHVDPMAIYGTNCLKFADGDEDESRPFLLRELHIVQPKLVVAMGEHALGFLNAVKFPLARDVEAKEGELQKLTPTIDALYTPDIDESLDEAPAKTRFWNAFKVLGEWWEDLPPY
jgi:uracil-DNA glycosylase